ncbi:MAG: hypothetical protein Q7T97_02370 [Burkholderiaceae bacterium]|nr:hypothetical protein [Burkholderiaceae bacterium]
MPDSLNESLVECVKACGGSAKVGAKLWPEKTPEAAQRLMLDCLNDDRPAKLSPEQVLFILRLARERGCHVGMNFLAASLSYAEPVPIEPRDEADELRRQVLEMGRQLQTALSRIEQLDRPTLRSAA